MYSYAEFLKVKRANVRSYAFVRRGIGMKRMSVNSVFVRRELRLHSNANTKLRLRLVVIYSLVREALKAL